jgi:hypothetical protein
MIQIIFKGKFELEEKNSSAFIQDIENLLKKHNCTFYGSINSFQFDDCEIIADEETTN